MREACIAEITRWLVFKGQSEMINDMVAGLRKLELP